MMRNTDAQVLFTPGPLNTSAAVKRAMLDDIGSRTKASAELTSRVCSKLLDAYDIDEAFAAIPIQGSGTFAVEAMLTSCLPADDYCVGVLVNGEYSKRILEICEIYGLHHLPLQCDTETAIDPEQVDTFFQQNPQISHLALVHFETGLGVLNELAQLVKICEQRSVHLLLDAISTFGALPIPFDSPAITAVALSANKCLHSVPGIAFVITRKATLHPSVRRTLSLDLNAQWRKLENGHQWRFTPPTHVLLAFDQALDEWANQGKAERRLEQYQRLNQQLVRQLAEIGIVPLLDARHRAPMITTFLLPDALALSFEQLYRHLEAAQLIIYPSTYSTARSFRIGCIGELVSADIDRLTTALLDVITSSPLTEPVAHA
ncbi:2-aminoethylphosphonate aminotransferase [Pseudomonas syringae]|uniref:2-aminoethylphosphonate--pyruvate transaminase n=1 Tax=Pseudomonas syringae pv. solidagae TaxID=264458 RepID=A0A0P9Z1L0_PSESX|nr:2-aminoethylphosphonate--pyruvate transaminase [Pseudomonas syringae]KPY52769.1 2-aminoethylphosphonate--pyruvate transaminase [Pseudomonas syringae pv. solidagae]RMT36735.1 2-aminoethylphosphonate--pyruvate transaminase [Pseudomonas syringae pv. solidagae]RMT38826.1 2-aminoethylphosphonate--pyruvate transaminase [Pseudomonas syringae pv. solidagae]